MAEDVNCHTVNSRPATYPFQHLGESDEMPVSSLGGERPRAAVPPRQACEHLYRMSADWAKLWATFGVLEPDAVSPAIHERPP